jgi:hypothetical protein
MHAAMAASAGTAATITGECVIVTYIRAVASYLNLDLGIGMYTICWWDIVVLLASCKFAILLPSPRRPVSAAGAELERGLIQLCIVFLVYLHTHAWYIRARA